MKTLALAVAASMLLASAASAADLAPRMYTKAPTPVASPVYNWGGFYVGINGGGGSAHTCWDVVNNAGTLVNPPLAEGCHDATGGTLGGQIGYRWQAINWVFGVEAQGNWADFKGSNLNQWAVIRGNSLYDDHTRIDAFGLFTGQVGYTFDHVLLYAKGGAAVVSDKYWLTATAAGAPLIVGASVGETIATGSETRWGGVVGAGIEYGFAPHWSVGLEYDHLFMGRDDISQNVAPPFVAPPSGQRIDQDVDIGMVRVNYTFDGPVVARY